MAAACLHRPYKKHSNRLSQTRLGLSARFLLLALRITLYQISHPLSRSKIYGPFVRFQAGRTEALAVCVDFPVR